MVFVSPRSFPSFFRPYGVVVTLGVLLSVSSSATAATDLGKIMPLGDSITAGYFISGGYRDPLAHDLTAAGYSFQFVGSNTEWPTQYLSDRSQTHHEGHSGYVITAGTSGRGGITDNLSTWIGTVNGKVMPDIILLMIGTNDININYSVASAPDRMNTLINMLIDPTVGLSPQARLIVAGIVPIGDVAQDAKVVTFNSQVSQLVKNHQTLGQNISYIDMHASLTATDIADGLHPTQAGYNKMGEAWASAISVPEPGTTMLLVGGALGMLLRRGRR